MSRFILFLVVFIFTGALRASVELPTKLGESIDIVVQGKTGSFITTFETLAPLHDGTRHYRFHFTSPIESKWPQNNLVPGELYLPAERPYRGEPIIVLHILGGKFEMVRLIAASLAQAGVPTLWFKLPFYGERQPYGIGPQWVSDASLLMDLWDQGEADFQRACDVMSRLEEPGPESVNVVGLSMGGILAYSYAVAEPRVGKIATLLAGGNIWEIIQSAHETRKIYEAFQVLSEEQRELQLERLSLRDPLLNAPKLRAKAAKGDILMFNAREDEVVAPIHSQALAESLGIEDSVIWYEHVGHYTMLGSLHLVLDELKAFLIEGSGQEPPPNATLPPSSHDPKQLLGRFMVELGQMINPSAVVVKGDYADLAFVWEPRQGKTIQGRLQLCRASATRYSLIVSLEGSDSVGLGQDKVLWVLAGPLDTLFVGQEGEEASGLLSLVSPEVTLKVQMLSNVLQYSVAVPGLLDEIGRFKSSVQDGRLHLDYTIPKERIALGLDYDLASGQYTDFELSTKAGKLRVAMDSWESGREQNSLRLQMPKARTVLPTSSEHLRHLIGLLSDMLAVQLRDWQ